MIDFKIEYKEHIDDNGIKASYPFLSFQKEYYMFEDLYKLRKDNCNRVLLALNNLISEEDEFYWSTDLLFIFSRKRNSLVRYPVNEIDDGIIIVNTSDLVRIINEWKMYANI
jgi:hypothetical protein